jgi:small subunit ribosomal protein S2
MGIFHYWQIGALGDEDIQKIDDELTLHGRIGRDDWIAQARRLAEGEAE